MYNHGSSVFNNSCLKVPRKSRFDHPQPLYEQKYIHQLENEAKKLDLDSNQLIMKSVSENSDKATIKSYMDFFDSIPEYDEINHLSNKEFYKQLENLREKQKTYYNHLQNEIKYETKDTEWIEDYKKLSIGEKKKPKSNIKPFCTTPILNKSSKKYEDDSCYSKPPSRRSVRIETPSEKSFSQNTPEPHFRPKSRFNLSSATSSKGAINDWDDYSINNDDFNLDLEDATLPLETKSAPNSPGRSRRTNKEDEDDGITIPKPFQMTVRDEENKIVEELYIKMKKPSSANKEMFKAHDVPIESQIPLFDKIMADQERKNYLVRERRKIALQSQMKPFSFTERDEEIQALTKRLSKSSPSLYLDDVPLKIKKFKAKPIPKNLFSNYIYRKMNEDEFYRALQKKIRAEEMLKAASLPPSMAKREKSKQHYDVCPRSYKDCDFRVDSSSKKKKKSKNELEDLKAEFIYSSPRGYKIKSSKRDKKNRRYFRNASASSKTSSDARTLSSLEIQNVNRSNLAAVLRIQSARQRLEMDMCKKLEEAKLKEEARWREKLMRKKPVWQTLAYSHEEDLAMRLQLRRDEEKLRHEEHRLRMQFMLGRVNQQPTLFERQAHCKFSKTKEQFLEKMYKAYVSPKRSLSDLSDIEMKDDGFLEKHLSELKESYPDEKKSESSSNNAEDN